MGLFPSENVSLSKEEKVERAKKYYYDEVEANVRKQDLVYTSINFSRLFLGKSVSFQPIKKDNKETEIKLQEFLKYRGLSDKIIEKTSKEELAISGDFYVSRIKKEIKEDGVTEKYNYGGSNSVLFRLRNNDKSFFGAENFQIDRTNDPERPFNYDKMNTGTINGRYFAFGELKKPEMAVVHEAIVDSFSTYDLFTEMGINAENVGYYSSQGASHLKRFFIKNLGFWSESKINMTDKEKENRTQAVYENVN